MYESYTKSGGQDMNEMGNVNISEDVIVTISNIAANEIEGVAGVYSGIADALLEIFRGKKFNKGVPVVLEEEKISVTIIIDVEYGRIIPEVAKKVQENVKNAIESMTEREVNEVNVHVHGVVIKSEKPEKHKAVSE
ncbi:MAG: Asp23/Gls24 family envelope stress response protein [Proteocatella sp.]|nr:Asp23/Gls24 family envelope stress response protein [Proteocatella sp.]MBP8653932.1 Asp23/Gls24 family envelope stress response protein [Proteocatella sp.]MBP9658814.1 Asp23/Gls24 family envelope stress response protein [Proteocatella sp.]